MFGWTGRRVLVTGASSGIGAALSRELAAAGAVVGLCARRTELLDAVLADCRASQPDCQAWTVDLSDLDGIDAFARRVEEEVGPIDVLVNNAAQSLGGEALTTPWEDIEHIMHLDYLSPIKLTRALLPAMLARGSGRVVTISSMAARTSTPGEAPYSAAKAALSAFFEALAGEFYDSPLRFHLVYPALIDLTPGLDGDDDLAVSSNGASPIPAAVLARAVRRQIERGDLELYVPETMATYVAARFGDVPRSVEFMGRWHRSQTGDETV
jgi:short-subunit dehydrogenase